MGGTLHVPPRHLRRPPLSFGWDEPFVVDGTEQPLCEFPRHESSVGTVARLDTTHRFNAADSNLVLDFDAFTRTII